MSMLRPIIEFKGETDNSVKFKCLLYYKYNIVLICEFFLFIIMADVICVCPLLRFFG